MLLFQDLPKAVSEAPGGFNFPPAATDNATKIDDLYMFITWVSIFCTVLIFGVLFFFLVKYHHKRKPEAEKTATHNTPLELVWSILPGFVLAYMFWVGFKDFLDYRTAPRDSYEIQVVGQKWNWSFVYPGGIEYHELHVPANTPVKLILSSMDVLHSFWVPAFRTKMDAVPGRYTTMWFNAHETGEYAAMCTEYCGTKHSDMLSKVFVHEPPDFESWLEKASRWWEGMDPAEVGARVHQTRCAQCHSTDGTANQGPTWKGIWGSTEETDKGPMKVDENYIRQSILEPNAHLVKGFNAIMPTFKGRLKEPEISGVISYIKTLKSE